MSEYNDIDVVTMRAVGFEPDGNGGWSRVSATPVNPGGAVREALIESGHIFQANREAREV